MARNPVTPNRAKQKVEEAQAKRTLVKFKPGSKPVPVYEPKKNSRGGIRLGLTIKQMMKETNPRTRQLMNEGVSLKEMRKSKYGMALMCRTVTTHKSKPPTEYRQIIENLDENTDLFSTSKWIKVECTCENFKYERDYALNEKGSSDLKHSIDEPPDFTNPIIGGKRRWGVCKHLLKCFDRINASNK